MAMKRLFFVIFTTLIIASISLVDNASAKVFVPYNSPVFHTKDCKRLPSNIRLMEFPSVQAAINSGASACPYCINQTSTGFTNQLQENTTVPETKIIPQEPTGVKDEVSYRLYCDKVTGQCFTPNNKKASYIESFGDRDWKSSDYEVVIVNVKPISLLRVLSAFADNQVRVSDPNFVPDPEIPATFEGKPIYTDGKWLDDKFAIEFLILSKGYGFYKQVERYPNGNKKSVTTGYGLDKENITVRHGKSETFYESGLPQASLDFKYEAENGRAVVWYKNGKIMHVAEYQDGKLHGIHKIYDQDGNLQYKDTYNNGERTNRKKFDSEGRLKFDTDY